MTQGKASKEEAESCKEALDEVMKAMPKSKAMDFIGHFNDLFLFLDAVARVLPSEKVEQTTSPNSELNSEGKFFSSQP